MTASAVPEQKQSRRQPQRVRKLIEVAFPLDAVNRAGRAEKAVPRKGLPATMHLWWSRKPTGVARAVMFASLVDNPADRPDLWPTRSEQKRRCSELLDLVGDLARWDCPAARLSLARSILRQQFNGDLPEVVDPFCGGGAIPYAATTLGLPTRGVDLNPVAAITTRAITEIPTRIASFGPIHPGMRPHDELRTVRPSPVHPSGSLTSEPKAEAGTGMKGVGFDVAAYGADLITEVERRIGCFYPPVTNLDGSPTRAVSYLWARTSTCSNPTCGAEIPLLSTWWLSKKASNQWHARPKPTGDPHSDRRIAFEVVRGPKPDDLEDLKVGNGANYRCPHCHEVTTADAIRDQGCKGQLGLRLVAIQTFANPAKPRGGRAWTNACADAESAALTAWPDGHVFPIENHRLPDAPGNISTFGVTTLEDLLTPRQRLLMTTTCEVLTELQVRIHHEALTAGLSSDPTPLHQGGTGATAYAEAVATYLAITISRMANRVTTMTVHNRANGSVEQSFVQPGYVFYGDFPEADPFSGSTGSWKNALEHVAAAVSALPVGPGARVTCGPALEELSSMMTNSLITKPLTVSAQPSRADDLATGETHVPSRPTVVISTDPPYYDMFDYAALSELFYPWLRLSLQDIWPHDTATLEVPRARQVISSPRSFDGDRDAAHTHFETNLTEALAAIRDVNSDNVPITLYYGYQRTQRHVGGRSSTAWEALLSALISSGMTVVRTWPLRTERPEGVKSNSNALASSILLVCRSRPTSARTAQRSEAVTELRRLLPLELAQMRAEGIAPTDLIQALIGPGMSVFTSFTQVFEPDDSPMSVRTALQLIYQVLDEALSSDTVEFPSELDCPRQNLG